MGLEWAGASMRKTGIFKILTVAFCASSGSASATEYHKDFTFKDYSVDLVLDHSDSRCKLDTDATSLQNLGVRDLPAMITHLLVTDKNGAVIKSIKISFAPSLKNSLVSIAQTDQYHDALVPLDCTHYQFQLTDG